MKVSKKKISSIKDQTFLKNKIFFNQSFSWYCSNQERDHISKSGGNTKPLSVRNWFQILIFASNNLVSRMRSPWLPLVKIKPVNRRRSFSQDQASWPQTLFFVKTKPVGRRRSFSSRSSQFITQDQASLEAQITQEIKKLLAGCFINPI